MAQAVSRRPLTAEARVLSQVSPCEICGARSGSETGISPSTSICLASYHSTNAPYSFVSRWLHIIERLPRYVPLDGASVLCDETAALGAAIRDTTL